MSETMLAILGYLVDASLFTSMFALVLLVIRKPVRHIFGTSCTYTLWVLPFVWLIFSVITSFTQPIIIDVFVAIPQISASDLLFNTREIQTSSSYSYDALIVLFYSIWLAVISAKGIELLKGYRDMKHAIGNAKRRLWMKHNIALMPTVTSPMVWGGLKPMILLPVDFYDRFDTQQQQLILQHEVVHIKRYDNVFNLIATVVSLIFWFNPIIHIAHRAFKLDQEVSCDAIVLANSSTLLAKSYAQAMLQASQSENSFSNRFSATLSQWKTRSHTMERFIMLSKHQFTSKSQKRGWRGIAMFTVITALLSACQTQMTENQSFLSAEIQSKSQSISIDKKLNTINFHDAEFNNSGEHPFYLSADFISMEDGQPRIVTAKGDVSFQYKNRTYQADEATIEITNVGPIFQAQSFREIR